MVKTTPLNDDTHKYLKTAQNILYDKYDIEITIPDIIDIMIKDQENIVNTILNNRYRKNEIKNETE